MKTHSIAHMSAPWKTKSYSYQKRSRAETTTFIEKKWKKIRTYKKQAHENKPPLKERDPTEGDVSYWIITEKLWNWALQTIKEWQFEISLMIKSH